MALLTQAPAYRAATRVARVANVASANLFAPNSARSGMQVTADKDLTYLKLYSDKDGGVANNPTATALDADIVIPAGGSWPGTVGGVVWTGGAAVISAAATGSIFFVEVGES